MRFLFLIIVIAFVNVSYGQYPYRYYYPYEINEARIYSRWRIQDAYKERNDYLDEKENYLNRVERAYELNQREYDLKRRGLISSKGIVSNYNPSIDAVIKRKLIDNQKEIDKIRDNAFLMMWHQLSDLGKENFNRLSYEQKESRIDEAVLDYITK